MMTEGGIGPDPALANNSAADVGAMLDALRAPTPSPAAEPEPAPPAPEPPAEAAPEPPTNGAAGAPTPAEAAPAITEPPPPSLEEQIEALRHDRELDLLERDKLNEQLRLERLAREQTNTRAGALKKVATDLMREGYTPPPDATEYEDEARPETREFRAMRQEIDRIKEVEVQRAVQDAGARFAADNPDYPDFLQDMRPHTDRLRQEYSSYLDSGDPRLVREATRLVLKTALIDAKAERMTQKREEAKAKRAEQFAALNKQKVAAAPASAGAAPPPRPKPKTPQDYSADEAGSALDAMLR